MSNNGNGVKRWISAVKQKSGKILVRTTDGLMEPWKREKIVRSLMKETKLAEELFGVPPITREEAERIAKIAEQRLLEMNLPFVSAPLIRELVNIILLEESKRNPRFAVYRNVMTRVGRPLYDVWETMWNRGYEVRENANLQPNPETSHKKIADMTTKEAALLILPPHLADAHLRGDLHIHDLEYFVTRPFCQDYDLRFFYYYGLRCDGSGLQTAAAGPAKHPEVAILHAVKVLAAGQTNCAGGQGLAYFNVLIAPYLEGIDEDRMSQLAQMLLFETNETYVSRGGQLVFSSIQIEAKVPKIWRDRPVVFRGKVWKDLTYGDFEEEVRMFAIALLREYMKGDWYNKQFSFPKPEVRLRSEYFHDPEAREVIDLAVQLSAKFGSTYYDNLIPPYRDEDGVDCYQCCAFSFREPPEKVERILNFEDGAHFSMGGLQVVTINLPRIAYRANGDDDRFFEILREVMEMAKEILLIKRRLILKQAEMGNLPFLTQSFNGGPPLVDLRESVPIIGFVGMNETVQYHTGFELHESNDAVRFGVRVLIEMDRIRDEFEKETGIRFAIARTPAESTAQRLAILDLIHYRDQAIQVVKGDLSDWQRKLELYGRTEVPVYYTNGFMVRYDAPISLAKKIAIEQKAFPILSGGNIFHVFLGEAHPDPEALFSLTEKIATRTMIGYWSYTKDLTLCNECKKTSYGLLDKCPYCHSRNVEWFSRITGYYQRVKAWNAAKRDELMRRYRLSGEKLYFI
ncbi:MAG: anaerobic ribonucleoside-triphosphate reductase [Candidatus Baldrarchaeia archaeon]